MTDENVVKVSRRAVEAARAEVQAFIAAGIADQIDPLVQQIANVTFPPEPIRLHPAGLEAAAENLRQQISGGEGNGSDVIRVAPILRAYLAKAYQR